MSDDAKILLALFALIAFIVACGTISSTADSISRARIAEAAIEGLAIQANEQPQTETDNDR